MSAIRIIAAVFILASGVALFASDDSQLFALPLIVGNLLLLFDNWRAKKAGD